MLTRDDIPDGGLIPGSMEVTIYEVNEQPRSPRDVELKVTDCEGNPLTIVLWKEHSVKDEWETDAVYELSGGRGRRYENTAGNDVIIHSNDSFTIERCDEKNDITKLLVLGDTHLGYRHRSAGDKPSWGQTVDNRETMETALNYARELDVDAILHAGDIFDHTETKTERQYLQQAVDRLAAADIKFYYITGNHDTYSGQQVLERTPAVHIGGETVELGAQPVVVHGRDYNAGSFSERPPEMAPQNIINPTILMLHDTPYPVIDDDGSPLYRNDPNCVDLTSYLGQVVEHLDLIIVGHIHVGRFASLDGYDIPILVTGPTGSISSYEKTNQPSAWLVTVEGGEIRVDKKPL